VQKDKARTKNFLSQSTKLKFFQVQLKIAFRIRLCV